MINSAKGIDPKVELLCFEPSWWFDGNKKYIGAESVSIIVLTAYAHGSGRESLPPDVEVEVRAGERVECSPYVPDDGATT